MASANNLNPCFHIQMYSKSLDCFQCYVTTVLHYCKFYGLGRWKEDCLICREKTICFPNLTSGMLKSILLLSQNLISLCCQVIRGLGCFGFSSYFFILGNDRFADAE